MSSTKIDYKVHGDFIEQQLVRAITNLDLNLAHIAQVYLQVYEYFMKQGEPEKTWDWFTTGNPMFGNVSPIRLCIEGRTQKLLDFLEDRE